MTLILNILLILLLATITGLLILYRKKRERTILFRWSLFLGLVFIVTAFFRVIVSKEEHAATVPDVLSSLQPTTYSADFIRSAEQIFNRYFPLADQLAEGKLTETEEQGKLLIQALDSLNIEELVTDTLVYDAIYLSLDNARAETNAIIADPDLGEKRASFNILSGELISLLTVLRMSEWSFYELKCPDAFGKGIEGRWIGKTANTPNPYGKADCLEGKQIVVLNQPITK